MSVVSVGFVGSTWNGEKCTTKWIRFSWTFSTVNHTQSDPHRYYVMFQLL